MTVAFVLGGGGRWGAVEVGMLAALVDAQIAPDLIVGTSIGAVNGAIFGADPSAAGVERLEAAWSSLADSDVFTPRRRDQLRNLVRLAPSLMSSAPLEHWLAEHCAADSFDDLVVPFQCVAAPIERAAEVWFTSGSLRPALLASCSVPGLLPPTAIGDEHFYDGGLVNSVPISRAIECGATEIYILQVGRIEQRLSVPTRWFEAGLVAFEISRRHRFATVSDDVPSGVTVHLLPSGNVLRPSDRRQMKVTDFGDTANLIAGARRASTEYLAAGR